jgi:hypothetical protein
VWRPGARAPCMNNTAMVDLSTSIHRKYQLLPIPAGVHGSIWARLVAWGPFLAPWGYALQSLGRTVQCNHALGHFLWYRLVAYDTLLLHFRSHFGPVIWMPAVRQWLGVAIISLLATGNSRSRRVYCAASSLTTGRRQRQSVSRLAPCPVNLGDNY